MTNGVNEETVAFMFIIMDFLGHRTFIIEPGKCPSWSGG